MKFQTGSLVATPAALAACPDNEILAALDRHRSGDWGEVEDPRPNDEALITGERLLSIYKTKSGVPFWIVTEADRSATTVLLPSDY